MKNLLNRLLDRPNRFEVLVYVFLIALSTWLVMEIWPSIRPQDPNAQAIEARAEWVEDMGDDLWPSEKNRVYGEVTS